VCRRGRGLKTESGISSSPTSDMSSEDDIITGSLLLAAVLGFMSCRGSGNLLMEAVCIVDAISNGTESAILIDWRSAIKEVREVNYGMMEEVVSAMDWV
jgi:hypothetical protein